MTRCEVRNHSVRRGCFINPRPMKKPTFSLNKCKVSANFSFVLQLIGVVTSSGYCRYMAEILPTRHKINDYTTNQSNSRFIVSAGTRPWNVKGYMFIVLYITGVYITQTLIISLKVCTMCRYYTRLYNVACNNVSGALLGLAAVLGKKSLQILFYSSN